MRLTFVLVCIFSGGVRRFLDECSAPLYPVNKAPEVVYSD